MLMLKLFTGVGSVAKYLQKIIYKNMPKVQRTVIFIPEPKHRPKYCGALHLYEITIKFSTNILGALHPLAQFCDLKH